MSDGVQLSPEKRAEYWRRTSKLMWTILILWLLFSFGLPLFADQLNGIRIAGFPLGFYFAAQGSLIAFVVLCAWNARAQNKLDREFNVAED
jgi:putative solute:sodium symporter small subunit